MTDDLIEAAQLELRHSLEELRREIERVLPMSRESGAPVAVDTAIGRVTRADALQQQGMAQAAARAGQSRLGRVNAALDRMDRGTYGDCLGCGEPIALARLRVRPEAMLCLVCQDARERRS